MSLVSNLKIAHRVMLLAVVALVGIAAISAIFLVQRAVEGDYRAEGERLAGRQALITGMMAISATRLFLSRTFCCTGSLPSSRRLARPTAMRPRH